MRRIKERPQLPFSIFSLASPFKQAQTAPFREMSTLCLCLLDLVQAFIFTTGTIALTSKLISLPLAASWVIVNMNLMTSLPAIKPSMTPYCSQNKVQIP